MGGMLYHIYILLSTIDYVFGRFANSHSNLEPNDINELIIDQIKDELPVCTARSACAFLQANARGVNKQQLCKCWGDTECPLAWDTTDGRSITQGSDQYKFCQRTTRLSACKQGQLAYLSITAIDKPTSTSRTRTEQLLCRCPESHFYEYKNMKIIDVDEETEIEEFQYSCVPLPICESGQICKYITETSGAFLVNRKCNCPTNCPTIGSKHVESQHAGKGMLHLVKCM